MAAIACGIPAAAWVISRDMVARSSGSAAIAANWSCHSSM
jgi:hypothetical protein